MRLQGGCDTLASDSGRPQPNPPPGLPLAPSTCALLPPTSALSSPFLPSLRAAPLRTLFLLPPAPRKRTLASWGVPSRRLPESGWERGGCWSKLLVRPVRLNLKWGGVGAGTPRPSFQLKPDQCVTLARAQVLSFCWVGSQRYPPFGLALLD